MGFTVAITGRPNVGKSTLFNRLLEQRKAIVDDESGVTRDRQYGMTDWNGKTYNVIVTGGFVLGSEDVFEKEIAKQVLIAVEEAHAIIFMVDAATGITALDDEMATIIAIACWKHLSFTVWVLTGYFLSQRPAEAVPANYWMTLQN